MIENLQLNHQQTQHTIRKFPLCLIADNIEIASNVGSLFRLCDALGVEKLYLTGSTATPPNQKIRKTSRSTEQYVDYEYKADAKSLVNQLSQQGYRILCLEITNQSRPIDNFIASKNDKLCLIVGSEKHGVSKELLELAEHTLHIPLYGHNSSMNVATATAIAVHELTKVFAKNAE